MSHASSLSPKIAAIAESTTLKIDAKAKALKAQGRPIISYAAGEPDFLTPAHIVDAAREALDNPANFRYTQAIGLPELREAVAEKTLRDSGFQVDPSQVVITNGGKQAVYQAFQVLVGEGDEVLLPTPYWTTYPEAIQLAGGVTVPVFAGADQDYKVTVEQLEAARTEKTKVLVFVSPSNPTGAVYSEDEVRAIAEWVHEHNIFVIADEIYQNLVYDDLRALSIADAGVDLSERVILVNGVAKTYAMTGWRIGWMVGCPELIKGAANLQSHLCSNVNNIAQRAAIAALRGPQEPIEQMHLAFDRRRKLIVEELNQVAGFHCPVPKGAFYAYVDVREALHRPIDGVQISSSLELADFILEKAEVAVVPGEAFGRGGYLRFSYALDDLSLREGVRRLQDLFAR